MDNINTESYSNCVLAVDLWWRNVTFYEFIDVFPVSEADTGCMLSEKPEF